MEEEKNESSESAPTMVDVKDTDSVSAMFSMQGDASVFGGGASVISGGASCYRIEEKESPTQTVDAAIKAKEKPNHPSPSRPIDPSNHFLVQRQNTVERFWVCWNNHDPEGLRDICSPDYQAVFMGAEKQVSVTLSLDDVIASMKNVFAAFPDWKMMYRTIEESDEASNKDKGVTVIRDLVGTGVHTGTPFSFGEFPAIPATGKHVLLDAIDGLTHFDEDGRICKDEVIAMGENTGIHGIYILLGGTIPLS